jgi:TonB family protein
MIARARRSTILFLIVIACGCTLSLHQMGAQQAARRVIERTAPAYPPLARSMALQGIVKVDALVAPDGTVKAVEIKGGHPVLAQAAVNTVRHWKWEASSHESHELVEVKFSPE